MSRLPLVLAALFGAVFVALPLLTMGWQSISGPDGLTLSAYGSMLASSTDRQQLLASLGLGLLGTALAVVLGGGHAWLTVRTDLPAARFLGPLGVAPLVVPPILVAMGFSQHWEMAGFLPCAFLLGICYAPFVAVLTARGLRSIDGRLYEGALLARGRARADRMLLRLVLPELLAGALFAFIFIVSEHGVPEFLTVKGKTWHTYAEGIFSRWSRRAMGVTHEDLVSPIVSAVPLVLVIAVALVIALRLRAARTVAANFRPLPVRRLGGWRFPALLWPAVYLGLGLVLPVVVMGQWAAGITSINEPTSWGTALESLRKAFDQAGGDLLRTLTIGGITALLLAAVAVPLGRAAARRWGWIDHLSVVAVAVPGILLGIGLIHVFNDPEVYAATGHFYDSTGMVAAAYAARYLPFGVLTLSSAARRLAPSMEEAAVLSGRPAWARGLRVNLPLILPAAWSVACLGFILALRELDLAVVLPAGNGTVVRRLSNMVHFFGEDMGGALALLLLMAALLPPVLTMLVTGRKLQSLS